ncbi:MAG TPA: M36 family metallopeptidase, partial [Pyrinomonadaceae bacterium]
MQKSFTAEIRKGFLLTLVVFGLIAALIVLPYVFPSEAGGKKENSAGENSRQSANEPNIEDYDIRDQKNEEVSRILMDFRQAAGKSAVEIADIRDNYVKGETALRRSVPTLAVEYHLQLRNPEVIAPDVMKGGGILATRTGAKNAEFLRSFAKANNDLIGLRDDQLDSLKVVADYTNPNGELSFARLEQHINGVPVFRGEIRSGFNKKGDLFRVVNDLAPGLDYERLSTEFGNPADAVRRAAEYVNYQLKEGELDRNGATSTDLKAVFGTGDWATTAEKMYFPIETGVARPAWRILNWNTGSDVYYVIVDAETGTLLNREKISYSQTQPATYNVYANTNSILRSMSSPAPLSPNPLSPALGTQGTLQPRTSVTAIGNEAPYTFNNLGWMNDNSNGVNGQTDGNNVEAGIDHDQVNGVDATVQGTNRVFNFSYTPGAGANNGPGDDPMTTIPYRNGAATNLFYVINRYHDETYLLGFTEQARNFQNDNFGRGGAGNDRVSAEAQDQTLGPSCSTLPCANNANFATPADGGRGRMQMYIWNRVTPIRDGDLDAEVIVHEMTHGLFGRLHNGVSNTQAGQMNEGNSDFFAHVLLSLDTDPIPGVYVTGGYVTLNLRTAAPFSNTGNYYYGIRRFPKAVKSFTGGPNNRPHNPLTYADIDPAQMSLTDGAFAPAFAGSATAVHDGGEIWSSMMWEVRARLVTRLGAVAGSKKVLQLAMDGMKVAPSSPSMLQERNAILQAAQANGNTADIGDIWAGFATRGLGFGATNPSGNTVVESFNLPNASLVDPFSVSDSTGDNDGFPEPGENVLLNVSVMNPLSEPINNVTATVAGGGSANYGNIAGGATVVRQIPYTVPAAAVCGSLHQVEITVSSDAGTNPASTKSFRLGAPVGGAPATFSNTTAITIADNTASTPYPSNITVSGMTGNKVLKLNLLGLTHTFPGDIDILLVGPGGQKFMVMSDMGGGGDVLTPINLS